MVRIVKSWLLPSEPTSAHMKLHARLSSVGTSKPNPTAAHKAIMESANHAFKFLTWLRNEQDNGRRELQQLDLENASIEPYGPLLNGWYTMFVQLSDVDTFSICVDRDDYVDMGDADY